MLLQRVTKIINLKWNKMKVHKTGSDSVSNNQIDYNIKSLLTFYQRTYAQKLVNKNGSCLVKFKTKKSNLSIVLPDYRKIYMEESPK